MRTKITVVGAGNVGATCVQRLAERDYADVVLVDADGGLAAGTALDVAQAGPVLGYEPRLTGAGGYEETAGSEVVVIAAGSPGRSGTSGSDLLSANASLVREVSGRIAERSPDAVVIVVTDPVEAMCHVVYDATAFPRERVVGMGGIVDSARLRVLLASELRVSARDVEAVVLGGRGELMVPVLSSTTVAGVPVAQLVAPGRLAAIVERARDGEAELGRLLGSGSASAAPAAGVLAMVDAIVLDQRRVLPCAALCRGDYGLDGVFAGVPVRLGGDGIEEIVALDLAGDERDGLRRSADAVRELAGAVATLR